MSYLRRFFAWVLQSLGLATVFVCCWLLCVICTIDPADPTQSAALPAIIIFVIVPVSILAGLVFSLLSSVVIYIWRKIRDV